MSLQQERDQGRGAMQLRLRLLRNRIRPESRQQPMLKRQSKLVIPPGPVLRPGIGVGDVLQRTADPVPTSATSQSRAAVLAALSDVVTVTDPNNTDAAPKPLAPGPANGNHAGFGSRMAGAFNKLRGNKKGSGGKDGNGGKSGNGTGADAKGPSRIDVIDRLDASGLHGMSLFHHDSPYDACSAHSNRHTARAPPFAAFSPEDGVPGVPSAGASRSRGQSGGGGGRQNLSPLAQATLQRMNAADADMHNGGQSSNPAVSQNFRAKPPVHRSQTMDSYGSASTPLSDGGPEKPSMGRAQSGGSDFITTGPPTLAYTQNGSGEPAATGRRDGYITAASAYPTNERSDESNPLAEVWGIVPEPWQEFATPAARPAKNGKSSSRNGGNGTSGGLHPYGDGHDSGTPSAASSMLDMEAVLTGKTSSSSAKPSKTTNNAGLGSSEGTVRRNGGRYGGASVTSSRSASGADAGGAGIGAGGAGLDYEDTENPDFVISAGVSPFPEPDYGGAQQSDDVAAYGGYGNGGGPKRNKSLIKRMKSARQNPNMPALKLDTANVELGAVRKGSPSTSSPSTATALNPAETRRLRHLSSPVAPSSPGGGVSSPTALAPQYEDEDGSAVYRYGGGSAAGAGDDYLNADRGYGAERGGATPTAGTGLGGGSTRSGLARQYSPGGTASSPGIGGGGSPGGGGLGRSGSLFSKFGRGKGGRA
ncbi:hypothetical protein V8E36_004342 [Tilletia maclaganii]